MREDERFLKKLTEYFGKIFQEEIHRCYADASKEEQKIIYKFIAEGTGAAIRQWMAMGENLPAEQAAKIIAGRIHLGEEMITVCLAPGILFEMFLYGIDRVEVQYANSYI